MKQQGFCLSGCPPLSFLRSSLFLPPLLPPREPRERFVPFCDPRGTLQHPFFITYTLPWLRLPPAAPPYTIHLPRPYNNARVYTVCPYPPAYIFASYNIDYFGRISGRAARAETVSLTQTATPRRQPLREPPPRRARSAFTVNLSLSTTLPPSYLPQISPTFDVAMQTFRSLRFIPVTRPRRSRFVTTF